MAYKLFSPTLALQFCPRSRQQIYIVFAANTHSKFYHLVEVNTRTAKTVCGLSVAMILETEPSSAALHLVSEEPPEHVPCNHCLRITGDETPLKARAAAASEQTCPGLIQTSLPEMA